VVERTRRPGGRTSEFDPFRTSAGSKSEAD